MTRSPACCDLCGAPAIVQISNIIQGQRVAIHLCTECADRRSLSARRTHQQLSLGLKQTEVGAILVALGLFVFGVSALADLLQFGSSDGFGWRQGAGLILAGLLALMGSVVGVLVLVVIGAIIGVLTLLADFLAFGSNAGFGIQQQIGVLMGSMILLAGLRVMRREESRTSNQRATETSDATQYPTQTPPNRPTGS